MSWEYLLVLCLRLELWLLLLWFLLLISNYMSHWCIVINFKRFESVANALVYKLSALLSLLIPYRFSHVPAGHVILRLLLSLCADTQEVVPDELLESQPVRIWWDDSWQATKVDSSFESWLDLLVESVHLTVIENAKSDFLTVCVDDC